MKSLDYWRLCDDLSVVHAALLIVDLNPSDFLNIEDWEIRNYPPEYLASFSALKNAVMAKRIPSIIRYNARPQCMIEWMEIPDSPNAWEDSISIDNREYIYNKEPDWFSTTISLEDLKLWLTKRGFKVGFFFPQIETDKPDYLDISHPNYSQKLGAAIEAWLAITENPELLKAKTVKKALTIFLRSHALRFGLIKDDGNPNEQGIEEIAKIANWETKGGAPKTPSEY